MSLEHTKVQEVEFILVLFGEFSDSALPHK
jgi:hypothetical protein